MSGHLPECGYSPGKRGWGSINGGVPQKYVQPSPCICDQLRACEQRGYSMGYAAGVDDAKNEAAIALTSLTVYLEPEDHNDVINAIDALREKP